MCIVVQDHVHEQINKGFNVLISARQIHWKGCVEDWSQGCSFLHQQEEVGHLCTEVPAPSSLTWQVDWNLTNESLHETGNDHCLVMRDIWSCEHISSRCCTSRWDNLNRALVILDGCIGLFVLIIESVQDLGQSCELNNNSIDKLGMLLLNSHIMSAIQILMLLCTHKWEIDVFQDLSQCWLIESKMFLCICFIVQMGICG